MRTIHINTICRKEAKLLAPSGYTLRKKVGGFIAYESRLDVPKVTYNKIRNRKQEDNRMRYKARVKAKLESEGGKWFPFKSKEAYFKSLNGKG